jgi:hypothetical protein
LKIQTNEGALPERRVTGDIGAPFFSVGTKSRDRAYGTSVPDVGGTLRWGAQGSSPPRLRSLESAMVGFSGSGPAAADVCQLGHHVRFGQLALQHRDRDQEIVATGSQISGKGWVRDVGDIEDTGPLLLLMDAGIEQLNQVSTDHFCSMQISLVEEVAPVLGFDITSGTHRIGLHVLQELQV